MDDSTVMFRALFSLWATGLLFFLGVLLVSAPPAGRRSELILVDAIGWAVLLALVVGRHHLPAWIPEACAYLCYVTVGFVIHVYGDPASPYALFYLWMCVHAFYFMPWHRAARQLAFIAVAYGVTLMTMPGAAFPWLRWSVTVATAAVICTMVAILKLRVTALVSQLTDTAVTDLVTGLPNRRAFDDTFAWEMERADRSGEPLSLVLADLDCFKEVNDSQGHQAGDDLLRRLAAVLEECRRRTEPAMRLGGDEFALLLPNTEESGAHLFAERVRLAVRKEFAGDPVPVTMSLGVATYPVHGADLNALFHAADSAVYTAKDRGRDRSVVYSAA
jgi:diguanylate cyclase (GGDEF)-like protein